MTEKKAVSRQSTRGRFVLILAVLLGIAGYGWWSKRPAESGPWNTAAITASDPTLDAWNEGSMLEIRIEYKVHNNTAEDYRLQKDTGAIQATDAGSGAFINMEGVVWDADKVIPAGQTADIAFRFPSSVFPHGENAAIAGDPANRIGEALQLMRGVREVNYYDDHSRYDVQLSFDAVRK